MADDVKQTEEAKEAAEKAQDNAEAASDAAEETASEAKAATSPRPFEKKAGQAEDTEKKSEHTEKGKSPKVSKKLEDLIKEIEKLSVLELAELVHALEDKFGVSAQAPIAVAAVGTAGDAGEAGTSEQTTFNVILAEGGANKISVIKAVREIVPTLGLKEAKDLVDAAPKPVLEGANKENANEAKTKLEAAGAKVELK